MALNTGLPTDPSTYFGVYALLKRIVFFPAGPAVPLFGSLIVAAMLMDKGSAILDIRTPLMCLVVSQPHRMVRLPVHNK